MEEESKMVLRTEDLVKKYGKRTVVSHVSINVKQGEIVGLLGPNGAGKTTSFYMTVGLITPNEGRIFLDDLDITKYPVYKRAQTGIGYLAQEASVFRQMSVEDNIAAVLEMTDKPLDYQKDKLESLIAEFRLQKVRKNKGNQLSGGERRRTEIARCLAIDPKFIMLDEPFAGVDPIAVEDIQQIVWKLKDRNIGILITDHNVQETLSITDRAYLLFEGKILFQGTPEELSENFNTFCQTFRIHRSERPFPTFTTWNSASDSSGKRSLETKRPVWLKCNRSWMNCSDVLRKCAGLNGFIAKENYLNALPIAIQKSTICCSIRMTVFSV